MSDDTRTRDEAFDAWHFDRFGYYPRAATKGRRSTWNAAWDAARAVTSVPQSSPTREEIALLIASVVAQVPRRGEGFYADRVADALLAAGLAGTPSTLPEGMTPLKLRAMAAIFRSLSVGAGTVYGYEHPIADECDAWAVALEGRVSADADTP